MASFKTCVRSTNKEYNTVYTEVIHNRKAQYIKTNLTATKKQLNDRAEMYIRKDYKPIDTLNQKVIKYLGYKNKIYYFHNLLFYRKSSHIFATKGLTYDYCKGLRLRQKA